MSGAQPSRFPPPAVSVVIAAYTMRRWDDLRAAVASVRTQVVPVLRTVVVIDHHPELLAIARAEFDDVTVVPNAGRPGASATRNTGVAYCQSEVVAFLDDDAIATPTWLAALLRHFSRPEVVGAGGRLDPRWDTGRPRWFPPEFDWAVGTSYRGMPANAEPVRNVWTNGMAIRRSAFDRVAGFRTDFGKVGERSRPEDTDLCLRAAAAHADGAWIYDPAAVVLHRVPAGRATLRYFLRRCFNEGSGKAALAVLNGLGKSTRVERAYVRQVLFQGIRSGLRAAFHRDVPNATRGLAIVAGLVLTATGFLSGRSMLLVRDARRAGIWLFRDRPALLEGEGHAYSR